MQEGYSEEYVERHKALRDEASESFRGNRSYFTNYTIALAFALAIAAIVSFSALHNICFVLAEILVWCLLVGSGVCGLAAKWKEIELFRTRSLYHSTAVYSAISSGNAKQGRTQINAKRENNIIKLEKQTPKIIKIHLWILGVGALAWILLRASLAIMASLDSI